MSIFSILIDMISFWEFAVLKLILFVAAPLSETDTALMERWDGICDSGAAQAIWLESLVVLCNDPFFLGGYSVAKTFISN